LRELIGDKRAISFEAPTTGLSLLLTRLADYSQTESSEAFSEYEEVLFSEIRSAKSLDTLKDNETLRMYRDLYWTFGMDPTKLRVSSEALMRRVLRGENLWRISSLVDVANLASAYHGVPIGLIDEESLIGNLHVRTAKKDEVFIRIGGKELVCRGRELVLSDDEKIVCFGYATHDSEQTKVTSRSQSVLLVLYGAPGISYSELEKANLVTLEMVDKWVNCVIDQSGFYRLT
jgi:DNA/RNA-binding domain of Phe-tRNA-synthetase-like protein